MQAALLFVAAIWLAKSIGLYEEQVQEYEIEQVDIECQAMLDKMAIPEEEPKEYVLVYSPTPDKRSLNKPGHTNNKLSLI